VDNELERAWKERSWPNIRLSRLLPGRTEKMRENSQDNRSLCQYLNLGPLKCKAGVTVSLLG
jgi:hypothetical protein